MKTIKNGYQGPEVERLCELLFLNFSQRLFDDRVETYVKDFQKKKDLDADSIVGPKTWLQAFLNYRGNKNNGNILNLDYEWAAEYLDCEPESIMAVVKVEVNGSGFVAPGKPSILFEGHIFWKQLKKHGIDPEKYAKSNPNVVYSKWDKSKYKGGIKEYDRLEEAMKINREAALESISMGMFQIMGFNYASCGCKDVEEMWTKMCISEVEQFALGLEFIRINNLDTYLQKRDWAGFAKRYNGPEYYKNQYDKKLRIAYESYK